MFILNVPAQCDRTVESIQPKLKSQKMRLTLSLAKEIHICGGGGR